MNLESQDDALLIKSIADAQTGALETLYDRYNRFVFSIALAIVSDPSVAEEVTLDVFVHVWRGAKTYRPERAKVSTWLAAITRNHAIDILRWQRSHLDSKAQALNETFLQGEPAEPNPEESAELSLQRQHIRGVMAQLPEEQRQVLFLAYFKGYSHRQIAEFLKQPLGTIKTRIRLAMQKLRQMLSREDQPPDKSDDA